ncbi:endolytic transglycosylase MltG, partial [Geodermatophilus sp. DF01-2]|uniref:endolytic transglycosylase MltG n=1 Tax=Geodermatophilus sp. DF01-2 TaxID=2559610 RepID=UPI0010749CF9
TGTPIAELEAAVADPAALGLPPYAGGQLEGYLFPATYEFGPQDTAVDVLRAMVAEFTATAERLQLEERAAAAGRTPAEVVTVASMVQSETRLDEERADVAQVIYNRLDQGIPLGIDATNAYGLGKSGDELTVTDLETDGPYNTRTRTGLPPTPISNPGEASLEAALAPSTGDLLYYVLESEDGSHFFTSDYAEFLEARARCAAAGLGCGG